MTFFGSFLSFWVIFGYFLHFMHFLVIFWSFLDNFCPQNSGNSKCWSITVVFGPFWSIIGLFLVYFWPIFGQFWPFKLFLKRYSNYVHYSNMGGALIKAETKQINIK